MTLAFAVSFCDFYDCPHWRAVCPGFRPASLCVFANAKVTPGQVVRLKKRRFFLKSRQKPAWFFPQKLRNFGFAVLWRFNQALLLDFETSS